MPFALIHYITVINPLFTTFQLGGEKAVQTLERGVEAFGKWGQSNVYICRTACFVSRSVLNLQK